MPSNQGEKFREFLSNNRISTAKAAKKLGRHPVTIYQYFKSDSLTKEVISNILTKFDVQEEQIWGNEENKPRIEALPIRLADPYAYESTNETFYELADGSIIMQVPIITQRAYGSYLAGFADPDFFNDLETIPILVDKIHMHSYVAFEVMGLSMVCYDTDEYADLSIRPGRIAIGKNLPKDKWKYRLKTHPKDICIIVHKQKGILIKQIAAHDDEGTTITVHAINPEYKDELLYVTDIEQVFCVVQILNKKQ